MTIAQTNCAALRKLVTGKVAPQPKRRRPGSDLGTGAVAVMGSDLEAAAVKERVGDSTVLPTQNGHRHPN
jgi:hypothetical protein